MSEFIKQLIFIGQVICAMVLGSLIGLERKIREKEAGLRTHALVSGGACLLMIVSKYGFSGDFDAGRIAAQIVTGIGFLGAGMILYKKHSIHGLTTAAGIWVTAAIGMCVGAELYYLSVGVTLVIVIFQYVMHLNINPIRSKDFITYRVKFFSQDNEQELIKEIFGAKNFIQFNLEYQDERLICTGIIRSLKLKHDKDLKDIMEKHKFIINIEKIVE
ncbi:MAG TPA: MgtC/SapB family protein [Clostridiales bacterium]|nr:MgtC/SapB family protein [Clostridiales bacterium]